MKHTLIILLLISLFGVRCSSEEMPPIPAPEPDVSKPLDPVPNPQPIPILRSLVVDCDNGLANVYPCFNYKLVGRATLSELGSSFANDNWGWTDAETGKEYVLQGLANGVAFLDISSPTAIRYIGKLPTATVNSTWRDIKVYNNHAFIVSEAADHGLQVFDLTRLRNQVDFQQFTADALLTDFGSAHNIAINEDTGYAYAIGAIANERFYFSGGPVFIDISDPKAPEVRGGYADSSYTHDAHVVIYEGPDADYQGREILFGSNSNFGDNNKIVIVDVTNKTNPRLISTTDYSDSGFTHQGWIDPAQRYFYLGDEEDERQFGNLTRTLVFDVQDLDNPVLHYTYLGVTPAIDHNGYIKGDSFYLSNYTAGMREIDISNIANGQMEEVGYFDTYPEDDSVGYNGVWNVYPFFASGFLAISDSNRGLFLVQAIND
ncbi:MAG: choice-of-anchor B family protein [Flavobacteriaceae bacterium]